MNLKLQQGASNSRSRTKCQRSCVLPTVARALSPVVTGTTNSPVSGPDVSQPIVLLNSTFSPALWLKRTHSRNTFS